MGIRELREYVAARHGVFDHVEAGHLGVSRSQIRRRLESGDFVRLERGVVGVGGAPDSWLRRARVATLTTRGFLSHQSALALHGVDGFSAGPIHVTIPKRRAVTRAKIHIHRSTQVELASTIEIEGIRVSSVERALLDFGGTSGYRRLEWAVDAAIRQELCQLPELFDIWVRHSIQGRNGCGPMRRLLEERDEADPIPDSRWNRMVGQLLLDSYLPPPVYEHEVCDSSGSVIARVDLAFPKQRVAIELDSVRWHLNRDSFERDPRRKNRLLLAGWTVLTFTWSDYVDNPGLLVRTVGAAVLPTSA